MRGPNAVDFWRGYALVTIFINHIPGIYFEQYTHRNLSISDSAELFVFLAGWSLRYVAERLAAPVPAGRLLARLGGRAITIYAAHVLILSLAIAMLAGAAVMLRNPLILEWHNAAAVFYDPIQAHLGLVLLTHQLGYFDILPLYVVLMIMAPFIALVDRYATRWVLPLSLLVYLSALVFRITLPSWPVEGEWFFNPLAWQLVFVLGFVLAKDEGPGAFVRRHIVWFKIAAVPIVVAGALVVRYGWWPDPTKVPPPPLFFIALKSYLTPMRLIQFLALVILFSTVTPYILRAVPPAARFLSLLGRNSLNVFCAGSILSLAFQIVLFVYRGSIAIDIAIVVFGIGMLGLTAWLSEWQERSKTRA